MTKKRRHFTIRGVDRRIAPSRARPHKPTAKEIGRRKKAAALSSGGGKLAPAMRKELEREGVERRVKVLPSDSDRLPTSTRAGKSKPDMASYVVAVEARERREQRKSRTPETEPGPRAVPATRITRNEPKPGKHRQPR